MVKDAYPDDDRDLVRRCQAGSEPAFEELVRKYQQVVFNLVHHNLGYRGDVEDVAQKIFVKVYFSLSKFDNNRPFFPWLYRIAVNVCLNRMALKTPAFETIESDRHLDTRTERPDEPVYRAERAELVKAAIAKLPRKQRATLILRVYHELPHDEIAQILGSSVGAVKANFFHALNNLKRLLSDGPLA